MQTGAAFFISLKPPARLAPLPAGEGLGERPGGLGKDRRGWGLARYLYQLEYIR